MLVVKDTEGTIANRATALNNATANVAATITIILVPLCTSPSIQFIYKSYGFNLQNISQICQLRSKSIIITMAQTTNHPILLGLLYYIYLLQIGFPVSIFTIVVKMILSRYKLGFIISLLKTN